MNKIKLGDILAIQHGFAFKSQNYVDDSNYVLVTLANISSTNNFQYNKANMTFYGADFPKEYILKENDLIMPLTEQSVGLFGNTAFVPFTNNITFVLNQRVGKVIPKEEKTTKYYLHYLLSCEYVKKQLEYRASGTRQRNISPKDIYDVEVFIPEYNIQKKIGSLLYNIEQKININNKISDELEDMAKTIYNYWFLQFEFPNEEGKPYKSSGGKMVWNEGLKREIPEGWEVKEIGNVDIYISDFTANGSFAGLRENVKYNVGEKYALLIRPIDFNNNFNNVKDYVYINKHAYEYLSKSKLMGNEIIICNVGAVGEIYRCPELNIPMSLGPNGIVVNSIKYNDFLSLFFKSSIGQQCIKSISSGSIQLKFNKTNFKQIKICIPPDKILERFNKIYKPVYNKQKNIWKENRELTSLRDFLLPLLMNGQVGFKEDKAEG